MEVNWLLVLVRLLDGFLTGTGFFIAVCLWVWFAKKVSK